MLSPPATRLVRGALLAGAATFLSFLPACTWLVHDDLASAGAPCGEVGDCFAGQSCVDGQCAAAPVDAGPPPLPGHDRIGPAGGVVEGPDDVRLIVPANALAAATEVRLVRASSSLVAAGFVEAARFYAIVTDGVFSPSATLEIPIDDDVCAGGGCLVYQRSGDGAFTPLPAVSPDDATHASALVSGAGTFGAGQPLAPSDGGSDDAGDLDAGSGDAADSDVDGGRTDGGDVVAPPSFAACDLSAASCPAGEQCAPPPFADATSESVQGLCVRSCAADGSPVDGGADGGGPEGCACCGALPGWSGSYCLPEALCGSGQLGDACPNGSSDCDPTTTGACVDLGAGPLCSARCDGSGQCGDGCCVGSQDDDGAFCAPASLCGAAPDGALCFDDDTCASGRCASHDGVAPKRCTEPCTPGSCGSGLCCHPTTCSGEWLCVPQGICAATTALLCTDVCLSDAACDVDESCVDASCTEVP